VPSGQRWSDEDRERALQMLRDGVGTNEVARRTGIAKSAISRWSTAAGIVTARAAQTEAAHEGVKLAWAKRRGELTDRFGEVAATMLDKATGGDSADAKNFMTAAAIAVDKAQLLSGGVTSRHEQLDAERRRERVEQLQDELAERRATKDGTTGG
jgi:hypothetical protein